MQITHDEFEKLVGEAIDATPTDYMKRLQNVAFIIEEEPSAEQKRRMGLTADQTLLGLYEGVPLTGRSGATKLLPDKITIFKQPLLAQSQNREELRENIRHTVWHEIAHYFGLDHQRIYELDGSSPSK